MQHDRSGNFRLEVKSYQQQHGIACDISSVYVVHNNNTVACVVLG